MKAKSELGVFIFFFVISLILFLAKPRSVFLEQVFFKIEAPLATVRQTFLSRPISVTTDQRAIALDQSALASCREENMALKKLVDAKTRMPQPLMSARVFPQGDKLAVNLGRRDGLSPDQPVLAEGVLLGQVSVVGESVSTVRLLDEPHSELLVRLQRDGHFLLTTHMQALVLDRLKQDEDIQVGDIVLSAGENNWPPDLPLGQVGEVMSVNAKIFHQAKVQPLLDYRHLTTVFIGL